MSRTLNSNENAPNELRWHRLFIRKTELEIKRIFEVYRELDVEPIVFKGWVASLNYPDNVPRNFADIDLAIPSEAFERCLERNRSEQLTTLNIDLHRELRQLDTTPWNELFERSQIVDLDGAKIRVLSPEDHLRVLCTHWLTDGGQYKERLWDVYYAVANRPSSFNWALCVDSVSHIRRNWVITTIAIAKKYLDLVTDDLPFANELDTYPAWIDKCLQKEWELGIGLRGLETCLHDRKLLLQQIRKRLPPNPIQSTIEFEGLLDERPRIRYQFKSFVARLRPSVKRVAREIYHRIWKQKSR